MKYSTFLLTLVLIQWLRILTATPACPNGWTYLAATQACYLFVQLAYDFADASAYCTANNGQLTSITNIAEINLFGGWIGNAVNLPNGYWVCGVDLCKNGTYYWLDGQPWTSYSNSLFAPGYPLSNDTGQECLELSYNSPPGTYGTLLNFDCTAGRFFFCKLNPTPTSTTTTISSIICVPPTTTAPSTTPTKSTCPVGGLWSAFGKFSSCSKTCGMFGQQQRTRTCLSTKSNCPCSGSATQSQKCPQQLCDYPSASCSSPYKPTLENNKHVCVLP